MKATGWEELTKKLENIKDQKLRREIFSQITSMLLSEKAKSTTDGLTDILNRRGVEETLDRICERATKHHINYGVLLLDMDDFKKINDTLGHDAGDQHLKILADVMKKYTRSSDIPGRYGGDEFVVVLWDTNYNGTKQVAERILNAYKQRTGKTLSIGGAWYGGKGTVTPEKIKKVADQNVYEVKRKGRNGVEVTQY